MSPLSRSQLYQTLPRAVGTALCVSFCIRAGVVLPTPKSSTAGRDNFGSNVDSDMLHDHVLNSLPTYGVSCPSNRRSQFSTTFGLLIFPPMWRPNICRMRNPRTCTDKARSMTVAWKIEEKWHESTSRLVARHRTHSPWCSASTRDVEEAVQLFSHLFTGLFVTFLLLCDSTGLRILSLLRAKVVVASRTYVLSAMTAAADRNQQRSTGACWPPAAESTPWRRPRSQKTGKVPSPRNQARGREQGFSVWHTAHRVLILAVEML